MRKTLKLARREYKAAVHTKGFLIGLLIAPMFMGGSFLAMMLLKGRVDTTDRAVAVVDRSGMVAQALVEDCTLVTADRQIHVYSARILPA